MGFGFGTSGFGTDGFGGGSSTIEIASAFALDTNTVRVSLTSDALSGSGFAVGDAINPLTWTVVRLDTGAAFTVIAVRPIASDTYDVYVLEALAGARVSHRVASSSLRSESGVLIGPIVSADFLGVLSADFSKPVAANAGRRYPARDISNPPFPNAESVSGGFIATSSGDVAFDDGEALVRKLIYRRLTTPRGRFFHLKDYGCGFQVKEPVQGTGDMMRLKRETEKELLKEPEIDSVVVGIEQRPELGMLIIRVAAKLKKNGQVVNVESITQQG